jgi:hypothetical protein
MVTVKTINFGTLRFLGYITSTLCISALGWLAICPEDLISYGFGGIVMNLPGLEHWAVQDRSYINYPFLLCVVMIPLDFWILQTYSRAATSSQYLPRAEDTLMTGTLKVNQRVLAIPRIGIM